MKKRKLTNEEIIDKIIEYKEYNLPLALLLENYTIRPKQLEHIIDKLSGQKNINEISENKTNCLSLPTIARTLSESGENQLFIRLYSLKAKIKEDNKYKKIFETEYNEILEKLIKNNLGLINWTIENFFEGANFNFEDAQMLGVEAISIAIQNYWITKTSYFRACMVDYIIRYIQKNYLELTGVEWEDYKNEKNIEYYKEIYGRKLTSSQLSQMPQINLSKTQIEEYQDMIKEELPFSSIYESITESNDNKYDLPMTLEDYEEIDDYEDLIQIEYGLEDDKQIYKSFMNASINEVLDTLDAREKDVIIRRFGLNGNRPQSLDEIKVLYNLSRERIRTIEAKALRKLRHPSRAKKIRDFYITNNSRRNNNHKPSKSKIYNKLFDLLKIKLNKESLLVFMNMENLNWNEKDLNEHLKELKAIIECIVEGIDNNLPPVQIYFAIKKKENVEVSIEFIKRVLKEYEKKQIPHLLIKKAAKKM